ncbi:MAG TPA: ABC transporter permease [Bacillales bacterium]|nr:ABC transporter permease [Bacillales bacterium]
MRNLNFRKTASEPKRGIDPFWVIVQKEIGDHITSWRYIILLAIIALTCLASLYSASQTIRDVVSENSDKDFTGTFLFLKLFTITGSETALPSFVTFVSFLGPLLGIALGFDAINSERSKGTLSRMMSQPVPRDYIINAKFVAALTVISILFFALGFLVMGMGIYIFGIPPTAEEFWRIIFFIVLSIVYVAFWLNLAILFSVRFRQAATSALSGIAVWLFFSVFYNMLIGLIANATAPAKQAVQSVAALMHHQSFIFFLTRLSPSQLFSDGTTTLLTPSVRSLGPLTMQQVVGAIPSPLPLGQSLLLVWPQVTSLIAATAVCFGISYLLFMRQEIRSR